MEVYMFLTSFARGFFFYCESSWISSVFCLIFRIKQICQALTIADSAVAVELADRELLVRTRFIANESVGQEHAEFSIANIYIETVVQGKPRPILPIENFIRIRRIRAALTRQTGILKATPSREHCERMLFSSTYRVNTFSWGALPYFTDLAK